MSWRPFLCVVWAPVEKWLGENCKQMERLCLHSRQFNVCRIVVVNYGFAYRLKGRLSHPERRPLALLLTAF